jgi:hypothetical protein
MTVQEIQNFYKSRAADFSAKLSKVNKSINVVSTFRVVIAVGFIGLLYFGLTYTFLLYTLPVLTVIFVFLVRHHGNSFRQRTHLENLISIQNNELKALSGDCSQFDSGARYVDAHHPYTHDLDIFGEGSLFQYVNRCHTLSGKDLLAKHLSHPFRSTEKIIERQTAIAELSKLTPLRHEVEAYAMNTDEQPQDRKQLKHWVGHSHFLFDFPGIKVILFLLPTTTLTLLVLSFFITGISPFFWLCVLSQWALLGYHIKDVNAFHQYISGKKNILLKYAEVLSELKEKKFSSTILDNIQQRAQQAHRSIHDLAALVGLFDARLNSLTNIFVNSLLMYDLQCVYRLEKWKIQNASNLEPWLDTVMEIEELCSFSNFTFNNPEFNFPTINTTRSLVGHGLGHPLLNAKERVTNDIQLDAQQNIMIITGANMAGKSTFLRTIGVNVVLALAGAPVCATRFDCPIIDIRSGMRTADSLKDHQSYFYAELNRLKSIVDELNAGKDLLILLDEILKGTNSTDKQAGSMALVRRLVNHPVLALIATHDLVLGTLEEKHPDQIKNYCFEPSIENDQLSFDYKLKRGLAQKMNATFLMKKMGIIESQTP